MLRALVGCLVASIATAPSLLAQAQFIPIPNSLSAADITPDGQIVVGSGAGGAYFWRWQVDAAPTVIGGSYAVAVSDDGKVIAGNIIDPVLNDQVAAIWTQATGWQSLGYLQNAWSCPSRSTAYDMTGDGSTVVGLSWDTCKARAFKWTAATGMVELQHLGTGHNRASVISSGGELIGGWASGSYDRSPAVWYPDDSGTIFNPTVLGEVYGLSDDGSTILGEFNGSAFYWESGQNAVLLPKLHSTWIGHALDISADGGTIIGNETQMLAAEAWIWTPSSGTKSLRNHLTSLGASNVWSSLGVADTITPDGSIIVGSTALQGAWIATLPTAKATVYGCGGNPAGSMTVSGSPALGQVVTLGLDNPVGSQVAPAQTLFMFSLLPDSSYPCGLLVPGLGMVPGTSGEILISMGPAMFLTFFGPPWQGAGQPALLPIPVPAIPVLAGFEVYVQGAILGAPGSNPQNALTDAVKLHFANY